MPGNSQRKGAVRRKGKSNTAGPGGRVGRGLEGRGPTPKAEDREYHAKHQAKKFADRRTSTRPPRAAYRATRNGTRMGRGAATPCWKRWRPRSRSSPPT